MSSQLFSPFTIRDLVLPNRIVVSPMAQYGADNNGCASDWHLMHIGAFAVSGPGLVILEATAVEPLGRLNTSDLGIYSDECAKALERVVTFCRRYGEAKIGIQLGHAGRKASVTPSWLPRRALTESEGGWQPVAPSYIEDEAFAAPAVLDIAAIERIKTAWADAARRADAAGFDMIELHFAHGYLVNEFLSPLTNFRDDQYGGSIENRMRLALEIFELCRMNFSSTKPIGVRLSAVDWVPGGWNLDNSVALAKALRVTGCDYICASSGGVLSKQKIVAGPGYQVPFAHRIREEAGIPVIAVGQITEARQAEDIISSRKADLVALARRMLYNPRWAWHAAEELGVHLRYPKRFLNCHPAMGPEFKFSGTKEKTDALKNLMALDDQTDD